MAWHCLAKTECLTVALYRLIMLGSSVADIRFYFLDSDFIGLELNTLPPHA
jgi:hypothetical protein